MTLTGVAILYLFLDATFLNNLPQQTNHATHPELLNGIEEHLGLEARQHHGGDAGQQRFEHVQEHAERVERRQHANKPFILCDETEYMDQWRSQSSWRIHPSEEPLVLFFQLEIHFILKRLIVRSCWIA